MIINASDVVQVIHTTQVRDEERKFCIFVQQPGPPLVGELHSHCLGCFLFVFLLLFTLRRSRAGGRKFCIFGQPGAVVVRAASSAPASASSASTASSAPALHLPGLACHRCRERRVPRPSVASLPPTSEHLPCM